MDRLGGLLRRLPFIGAALMMAAFAGCGLPGFANFAGEITVFFGAWKAFPLVTILACWGALIIGAVYMLRAVRAMLHGPLPEQWASVADAPHLWRKLPFILLLASLLVFGCFPRLLTDKIKPGARTQIVKMASSRAATLPAARRRVADAITLAAVETQPTANQMNLSCSVTNCWCWPSAWGCCWWICGCPRRASASSATSRRWAWALILLYSLCCVRLAPGPAVQYAFGQMYVLDGLALFFKRFFLLAALIVLLMSVEFADRIAAGIAEFYALILFALAGMLFAASANDFALLFVSLELITVTFYVLTSFQRGRVASLEAGVKYLIIGALSTGLHRVWHRAGLWHLRHTLNFGELAGVAAQFGGNKIFLFGLRVGAGRARIQDRRVSLPDLGAGCLSGRAHADDRVPGHRLEGRRLCPAAARAVHRRAGHHGALGQPADHHFRHHHSLRQPLRDSAAQPQAAARLFQHRARRLSAAGRRGPERRGPVGRALLPERLPVHRARRLHRDLPRAAAAWTAKTSAAWPACTGARRCWRRR